MMAARLGILAGSVNSHKGGSAETRFTLLAQFANARSMADPMTIAQNLEQIRNRIAEAARDAGREAAAVTLVAVSKTHPQAAVLAALGAGQHVFGENRVQEAAQKFPLPGARLHLIGALQTNKAAEAVRLADCIESLDRPKLLRAIANAVQAAGKSPDLLVQVNIGDEPQKAGVAVSEADALITEARREFGDRMCGLMCIPPAGANPAPYFQRLAALADEHGLAVRSMGMSGDFEAAIAAGATHVRVGTAIFGSRPAPKPELF
jgi:pyridoxal phosphate enzyme (YggS family)